MKNKSVIKEQIKSRSRWAIYGLFFVGVLIMTKVFYLQTAMKTELLAKVVDIQMKQKVIQATRGNIYATDGRSLLATSIPQYVAIIDPSQAKKKLFDNSIDSLSRLLAGFFNDKSYRAYKEMIVEARKSKLRYIELGGKKLDHTQKMVVETFPLFREGANKGGGRFDAEEYRFLPFNNLAMRTIGKLDRKNKKVGDFGIEASFENYLKGKDGKGLYERMAGGVFKPVDASSDIDAEPGLDVVSTIDVNFQDIVETALKRQVFEKQAKYGTAVIMEIATGHVKAIANLTRTQTPLGEIAYVEDQNYAVKAGTDPGSTFKLASMAALLEKADLDPNAIGVNCTKEIKHKGLRFTCSHQHGQLTVKQIFEQSCNIGIYNLMKQHFGFTDTEEYFNYLKKFRLDQPSGFQLKGEPYPLLKNSQSASFSITTVPWMSIGYESRLTPIQMLTFYNAIANNGYWVQPIIVKETRRGNEVIDRFEANQLYDPICSENTVKKVLKMMEGVVENGTAKNVNFGRCKIAGKTGTSQKRVNGRYQAGLYYTSFVGYFPANEPKYSCIVVIDEPVGNNLFAADVSAPVFKSIADKIFAYDISVHPMKVVEKSSRGIQNQVGVRHNHDLQMINEKFGLSKGSASEGYVKKIRVRNDSVVIQPVGVTENLSGLMGMSLKDALPFLENKGFRVQHSGLGKVKDYTLTGKNSVALVLK
jgi:cell division protein FtsI (penicillin-binding protein 3)